MPPRSKEEDFDSELERLGDVYRRGSTISTEEALGITADAAAKVFRAIFRRLGVIEEDEKRISHEIFGDNSDPDKRSLLQRLADMETGQKEVLNRLDNAGMVKKQWKDKILGGTWDVAKPAIAADLVWLLVHLKVIQ